MIEFDTSGLESAMKEWQKATGKGAAEACNRAGRNTLIQASKRVKVVSKAAIEGELEQTVMSKTGRPGKLKYLLVSKGALKAVRYSKRFGNAAGRVIKAARKTGASDYGDAISGLSGSMYKKEIERRAVKKVRARKSATGYILRSIKMAGKAFGWFTGFRAGGWSRDSRSTAATEQRTVAELSIAIPARAVDEIPLQASMDAVADDMMEYAAKKMAAAADRLSAR